MVTLWSFATVIQKWCLELTPLLITNSLLYDSLFLLFEMLALLWSLKLLFKLKSLNCFYISLLVSHVDAFLSLVKIICIIFKIIVRFEKRNFVLVEVMKSVMRLLFWLK